MESVIRTTGLNVFFISVILMVLESIGLIDANILFNVSYASQIGLFFIILSHRPQDKLFSLSSLIILLVSSLLVLGMIYTPYSLFPLLTSIVGILAIIWMRAMKKKVDIDRYNTIVLASLFLGLFMYLGGYQVINEPIGTDEGNFLYTSKLILEGNLPYKDFFSRESGSLLFLIPYFSVFPISFENLRILVLGLQLASYFLMYLTLKRIGISTNNSLLVIIASLIMLQGSYYFRVFPGIFYSFFILSILGSVYFGYSYMLQKKSKYLICLGALIGIGSTCYKGSLLLGIAMLSFILYLNKDNRKELVNSVLIFMSALSVPILLYWIVFASYTSFTHIYMIVWGDLLKWTGILLLIAIAGTITIIALKDVSFVKKLLQDDLILVYANILFFGMLLYRNWTFNGLGFSAFESYYSGVIIVSSLALMLVLFLNGMICKKYRYPIIILWTVMNLFVVFNSYGQDGFMLDSPRYIHTIGVGLLVIASAYSYLIPKLKLHTPRSEDKHLLTVVLILSSLNIFSGYLMPIRFEVFYILLAVLLGLFIKYNPHPFNIGMLLLILGGAFTLFTSLGVDHNYYLYEKDTHDRALEFMEKNLQPDDTVFSLDTSILSEIAISTSIKFNSPFQFMDANHNLLPTIAYNYSGFVEEYEGTDLVLDGSRLLKRTSEKRTTYILGTRSYTLALLKDMGWYNLIETNYTLVYQEEPIQIFKINYQ